MQELQFNGIHFVIVFIALVVGFAMGAVYGWVVSDEVRREREERAALKGEDAQ